jgi:hypothetical protein
MSHGLLVLNNNNQVLVSSDTRNLHFIGKASYASMDVSDDEYGGIRIATFTIACSTYPVPFLTMPTGDRYAISRIYNVGGNSWNIEVIRSGTGTFNPEVYVFADPRSASSSEPFGMIVYRDDGTPSFDSRLRPLAITGGLSVVHPSNPKVFPSGGLAPKDCSSTDSACGPYFAPTAENAYSLPGQPAKPMFFYPSLAQAERENIWSTSEEDCLGSDKLGVCLTKDYYQWASRYWAFYRGGIRFSSSTLYAGWITVSHGCNSYYRHESSLLSIGNIIDIPVGSDSWVGGKWPYSNETLNLDAATVLVGDASRYD